MANSFTRACGLLLIIACAVPAAVAAPPITAAAITPDGGKVVVGSQSGIEVRSLADLGEIGRRIDTRLAHVHHLAFSPTGDVLAAAGGTPAESGEVELFRWPDGQLLERLQPHDDLIYCLAWSSNGDVRATASADGTVLLDGDRKVRLKGHSRPVTSVVFLPDGKHLVSAGLDNSLRVWDATTGELRRTLNNHTAAVRDLAVLPAAEDELPLIASAGADRTVRLWQPTIGRMVRFARLPAEPLDIQWTQDGQWLLASCVDGKVRVIDPPSVEVAETLTGIDGWAYTLAATSAREALVAGENGQVRLIRLPPKP